ncbi:MAG: hypothetical protein NTX50_27400 [Candidatus Sumerlaeota bacterium]|nr:hypothetical protein [Candidatus Sumerlaeota bacterium]
MKQSEPKAGAPGATPNRAKRFSSFTAHEPSHGVPAALARSIVLRYSAEGDAALDPFCAGLAPVTQSVIAGRRAFGLARERSGYLRLRAALDPPSQRETLKRLIELRNDMFYGDPGSAPAAIQALFPRPILSQLVHLRNELDADDPKDGVLLMLICDLLSQGAGMQGAKTRKSAKQRTRSVMPPGIEDFFDALIPRLRRLLKSTKSYPGAQLWFSSDLGSARKILGKQQDEKFSLIFGAPPQDDALSARTSTQPKSWQNASRWFLKEDHDGRRHGAVPPGDIPGFLDFMLQECRQYAALLAPGGVCALWLQDAVLKGHPRRVVRMADRLWERLREAGIPLDREKSAPPPFRSAAHGQLLILRKPAAASGRTRTGTD